MFLNLLGRTQIISGRIHETEEIEDQIYLIVH